MWATPPVNPGNGSTAPPTAMAVAPLPTAPLAVGGCPFLPPFAMFAMPPGAPFIQPAAGGMAFGVPQLLQQPQTPQTQQQPQLQIIHPQIAQPQQLLLPLQQPQLQPQLQKVGAAAPAPTYVLVAPAHLPVAAGKSEPPVTQVAAATQPATEPAAAPTGQVVTPVAPPGPQLQAAAAAPPEPKEKDSDPGQQQDQQSQIFAAAVQAQQAQYLQQYQFLEQMQAQESKNSSSSSSFDKPSRFKDNYRPMRLCKHLLTLGSCRQAGECTFAHSFDELHPASPDLPKVDSSATSNPAPAEPEDIPESSIPDVRLKKKREMCGRFSRGECSLGKVCPFAHSEEELGKVGLVVCGKVKTRLCTFWAAGHPEKCIYGSRCNNAHGEREIGTKRPPPEVGPPMKRRREGESVIAGKD
mmetsp:Transcript_52069/g.123976  ORF Transcript_52069/g.123976 Transcript_52069/m.123976 type:complete len:410 (+) Transcript_52069:27-1256(+)